MESLCRVLKWHVKLSGKAKLLLLQVTAWSFLVLAFAGLCLGQSPAEPQSAGPKVGCIGLHGGVFSQLEKAGAEYKITFEYLTDQAIAAKEADLSKYALVMVEHLRSEDRDNIRQLFIQAKRTNPELKIVALGPNSATELFADLGEASPLSRDPEMAKYYGTTPQNLRKMMTYIAAKYLGQTVEIQPAEEVVKGGLFHPDHETWFASVDEFLAWNQPRKAVPSDAPRVAVAVHQTHLVFQQPAVVTALIRELEKRGICAVAIIDMVPGSEEMFFQLKPDAVIHTCHSRDSVKFREALDVPHLHSMFFRSQSIEQWKNNPAIGLSSSEQAFQITTSEILGAIEPQIGAGTLKGGGSEEDFTPIPERIEHLVDRTVSWVQLRRLKNAQKKIAVVYYDREMGKAELMRGTASGMFMNAPRSFVGILRQMKEAGYHVTKVPRDEDELIGWMQDHGRQIGIWAPEVLDELARSGKAVLIPLETYQHWFETLVPEEQQKNVITHWGPAPGNFVVWKNPQGKPFIVIPRIELGNVIMLPQPLRGEAHDPTLLHNKLVPPPHNYLATYFWLQQEFGANAVIHFGTHGSEFVLPGKASGLSESDWPDILLGGMPNINPWIVNNLGESTPVRRRAYAVLIDHLTPPVVPADLSDELLSLHQDIHKWETLEAGALREKFQAMISEQIRAAKLDSDLKLTLEEGTVYRDEQIEKVSEYLHDIVNESTPISLHQFGSPPPEELLYPYLTICLRKPFLDALAEALNIPTAPPEEAADQVTLLREKGTAALELIFRRKLTPEEAVASLQSKDAKLVIAEAKALPEDLQKQFDLAKQMYEGFQKTPQEIEYLLRALDGRFIPPGPGNSPDRNPAVLPTGRNMVVINPEEIPSKPSWETAKELIDGLLETQKQSAAGYPRRIAFTLTPFAAYSDYGVMEAQILYLMGVKPVWDAQNLVTNVELIPAAELGRPRIDIFLATNGYYRDLMPSRMALIDKAVQLAIAQDEPDNFVRQNALQIEKELVKQGREADLAKRLAGVRMFGPPAGQIGSASYYYLVERSGEWNSREELAKAYLQHNQNAYGQGFWGEPSKDAYTSQIQGTSVVLRNWSDRTRSPLANKYDWYQGGSLALAVEHLTGKSPEFLFSDLRDPDKAQIVSSEEVLTREFRVRLFNRKWIEGMMKEGYAGADQVAVHASNTLNWKVMRPGSVSDETFAQIVDIYVRDSRKMGMRNWFEKDNPFAFQELNEVLLEAARKGYWNADEKTLREVATAYAESVLKHGENGGLRGGGNQHLERFVDATLRSAVNSEMEQLAQKYREKMQAMGLAKANANIPGLGQVSQVASDAASSPANTNTPEGAKAPTTTAVEGKVLVEKQEAAKSAEVPASAQAEKPTWPWLLVGSLGVAALIVAAGFFAPRRPQV
ncbi:MAG: cobaltochelatase subunit CobN [Planctomycetaceae bacterium]